MVTDLYELPPELPVPGDDGACRHLLGLQLPTVELQTTTGETVDLAKLAGATVVYIYPAMGVPNQPLPDGWNDQPGARGCTPQTCAYRDLYSQYSSLGVPVFGLSAQSFPEQCEAAQRLQIPFALIHDKDFMFASALNLPTFQLAGKRYLSRATLVISSGEIVHVNYPVFPPNQDARKVYTWLNARSPPEKP